MPNLTGSPQTFATDTSVINANTPLHPIRTIAHDPLGNVYVYLGGVASTLFGSFVKYDEAGSTTLLAADAVGPVAVAMAANTSASGYAWYQIFGINRNSRMGGDVATDVNLFISGTSGYADDLDVAGDFIVACSTQTTGTPGGTAQVFLAYPYVTNIAYD